MAVEKAGDPVVAVAAGKAVVAVAGPVRVVVGDTPDALVPNARRP